MSTAKAFLDTRRELKDGKYPLVIRIRKDKTRKDLKLNIYLREEDFDSQTQKVKRAHPNHKEINQRIRQSILDIEKTTLGLELKDEVISADKIKNTYLKPTPKLNFIQFGERMIAEMLTVNRIGNATAYGNSLKALKKYSGRTDIQFIEMNYELLCLLEHKMLANGLKKNSIAVYNRAWRSIFNRAINESIVDSKYYPYKKYKVKGEGTAKRNITKEELVAIMGLSLPIDSEKWHARNYFILSYNMRGISFADMVSLKRSDEMGDRVTYRRKKTHKLYNVKLTMRAKALFDRYRDSERTYMLPVIPESAVGNPVLEHKQIEYATKSVNRYLKKIGEELGLGLKLTTYVARHSWATIAKRMGYSKDLIAEALGHEFGNKVTGIYLDSFDQEVIDDMNERVCEFK